MAKNNKNKSYQKQIQNTQEGVTDIVENTEDVVNTEEEVNVEETTVEPTVEEPVVEEVKENTEPEVPVENPTTEEEVENKEEEKEDDIFVVHPATTNEGIPSGDADDSNTAVVNEETQSTVEEEVPTANVEDKKEEDEDAALVSISPNGDDTYIKILTDIRKKDLICSRLEKAGIDYEITANNDIIVGPCATTEDAIAMKKRIVGCGLRCTFR